MTDWLGQSSPSAALPQALERIQQVLLNQGYQYVFGDDAAWPNTAVMMARGDSAVIVSPFPSNQLGGQLPLDKSSFALLLVGLCPAGEIEGFCRAHPGNIAFLNPQAGQWLVQGHHPLFDQHLLQLYAGAGWSEASRRHDCRSLLREARESGQSRAKAPTYKPVATITLILACVAAFFVGGSSLIKDLANYAPAVRAGEYWRLITCAFVHANEVHLFFNMMALWYFGRQVEVLQGSWRLLVYFFASVFTASIASLAIHTLLQHRLEPSVGASGGLFGLAGVIVGMVIRHRHALPPGVGKAMVRSIGVFLLYNLVFIVVPNIDMSAHAGGLVGGFLWALVISCPPLRYRPLSLGEKIMAILLAAACVAIAAGVITYLPVARI
jgi:rhomboid protease GluP